MRANMLYDEPFVAVFPSLVRAMGGDVTAAAVLQHIYFRSASKERYIDEDGMYWWPATMDEIGDEIGISPKQTKRVVQKLRDMGYLLASQLGGTDRRNFYAIPVLSMGPDGPMEASRTGQSNSPERANVPPYLRSERQEGKKRALVRKPVGDDPAFAAFWSAYPRRTAKGSARRAWLQALEKATAQDIIAGAIRYAQDPNREDQFTAHAATWLNGERWLDEPLPGRKGAMTMIERAAERDRLRELG